LQIAGIKHYTISALMWKVGTRIENHGWRTLRWKCLPDSAVSSYIESSTCPQSYVTLSKHLMAATIYIAVQPQPARKNSQLNVSRESNRCLLAGVQPGHDHCQSHGADRTRDRASRVGPLDAVWLRSTGKLQIGITANTDSNPALSPGMHVNVRCCNRSQMSPYKCFFPEENMSQGAL